MMQCKPNAKVRRMHSPDYAVRSTALGSFAHIDQQEYPYAASHKPRESGQAHVFPRFVFRSCSAAARKSFSKRSIAAEFSDKTAGCPTIKQSGRSIARTITGYLFLFSN